MKSILTAALISSVIAGCGGGHLTESQEYYVGRAMAAESVAGSNGVVDEDALHQYVAKVGWTVALASDRPDTYQGYNFLVLNSEDVGAWSAPSGFIFVTTGALKLMSTEDELAAVLAHEIAHVNLKHPEEVARKAAEAAGVMKALAVAGAIWSAVDSKHSADIDKLVKGLGNCVGDLMEKRTAGYGRESEMAADQLAVDILTRSQVGYNPNALADFMNKLPKREGKAAEGPYATHPDTKSRIEAIEKQVAATGKTFKTEPARTKRFLDMTLRFRQ